MSYLGMAMGRVVWGTRPAPNGAGYYFPKRVWDRFETFFETRGGFEYCSAPPRSDYI